MEPYTARTEAGERALETIAARPGEALLALDFDGVLAPIVADPQQSRPLPAAVAALSRLAPALRQVVIITGREARTAHRLGGFGTTAGLDRAIILGQYGVERWDGATGEFTIPPPPESVKAAAAELADVLAEADCAGARVENKGGRALGVHTRELPNPNGALQRLDPLLRALAERHGLRVEPGKFVLELRASTTDKGEALTGIAAETGARIVAYAGDDLGDLPAFTALGGLRERGIDAFGLYSASEEQRALLEQADVVCEGPEGVAAWLTALADAVSPSR